ncbi:sugar ABC transporter substrate-binding protein [Nocardioides immobilis]|nr:sugar ABC transporter substrate-binding protein [Nocardioides immobilis]
MTNRRIAAAAASFAALSAVLAGCGLGTAGDDSEGGSSGEVSELQETAQERVEELRQGPATYPGPTEPFDVVLGKAVVIQCGSGAPICKEGGDEAVAALEAMGWETGPAVDQQFSPQVGSAAIDRAVADGVDGIIIIGSDVNPLKAAVNRALDADIAVLCATCASGPEWAGKVYDVTVNFYDQGVAAAWKVISEAGDDAKVHGFRDLAFLSATTRQVGLVETIEQECPDCEIEMEDFSAPEIAKPGPPQFSALLASNPQGTLDYVVGHYDGFAVAAAKTEKNAGRTDIKIGGYDGYTNGLEELASNNPPMDFIVAEAYNYHAWAAVDLLGRIKAGAPLWEDYDNMQSTLIDSTNVQQYLDQEPDHFPGPPNYRENLTELWQQ